MKTTLSFDKSMLQAKNEDDNSIVVRVREALNKMHSTWNNNMPLISVIEDKVTFIVDMSRVGQLMSSMLSYTAGLTPAMAIA